VKKKEQAGCARRTAFGPNCGAKPEPRAQPYMATKAHGEA